MGDVYEQFAGFDGEVEILPGRAGIFDQRPLFGSLQNDNSKSRRDSLTLNLAPVYDGRRFIWGNEMAKKNKLTQVAVRIGTAVGKADRTAHRVARAGGIAKAELEDIAKQVDALKRQLQKTTKRLKAALR